MGCFLAKGDKSAYSFALESFTSFGFPLPSTIMTDQERALIAAIKETWPSSRHLYCIFHISRNVKKNVPKYLGPKNNVPPSDPPVLQRLEDEEEFKKKWQKFVSSYTGEEEDNDDLQTNTPKRKGKKTVIIFFLQFYLFIFFPP